MKKFDHKTDPMINLSYLSSTLILIYFIELLKSGL